MTNNQGNEFVLVDKIVEVGKHKVHLYGSVEDLSEIIQAYQNALLDARGVPLQAAGYDQSSDPYVTWLIHNRRDIYVDPFTGEDYPDGPQRIHRAVVRYYERVHNDAFTDAGILAVCAKTPQLDFDPKPYEKEESPTLPGLVKEPEIRKNIAHPVERRLKQLLDLLEEDPAVFFEASRVFSTIALNLRMRLEGRTSEGFQPEPTDGSANKKAGTASKE